MFAKPLEFSQMNEHWPRASKFVIWYVSLNITFDIYPAVQVQATCSVGLSTLFHTGQDICK